MALGLLPHLHQPVPSWKKQTQLVGVAGVAGAAGAAGSLQVPFFFIFPSDLRLLGQDLGLLGRLCLCLTAVLRSYRVPVLSSFPEHVETYCFHRVLIFASS